MAARLSSQCVVEKPVGPTIEKPVATVTQPEIELVPEHTQTIAPIESGGQEIDGFENLDLCAVRDGKTYYFTRSEWNELGTAEQSGYDKRGVVVVGNGERFVLSLHHRGPMTWDDAMAQFGNSLPTKEQADAMAAQHGAINSAIRAFGGDSDPEWWYWTGGEYDSSYAWVVNMKAGFMSNYNKTSSYRVRTVSSLH